MLRRDFMPRSDNTAFLEQEGGFSSVRGNVSVDVNAVMVADRSVLIWVESSLSQRTWIPMLATKSDDSVGDSSCGMNADTRYVHGVPTGRWTGGAEASYESTARSTAARRYCSASSLNHEHGRLGYFTFECDSSHIQVRKVWAQNPKSATRINW
jgi:hypothetical protein